ncbi:response regulator transcription factor [Amycolatopsis keratiniphila]|uniref:Transcriptional regulator, LuxR family n=1 Tax=Amycolatopsis keratiniphila TaxID=129921 RepID=R4TBJ7_9PSEU|nr:MULTISPECIES: response regulator transcription factor [Amycolatopsis]AGM07833.1 transcriptional regulator, LuxR family [Amycolatopsis keratiniphila]RSN32589.1 DNA-binding response regulator [Amycolatopsis sp. WAC 04169]
MDTETRQITVAVHAPDPITTAGLASQLGTQQGIDIRDWDRRAETDVLVFAAECLTPEIVLWLRRLAAEDGKPVVLVVSQISEAELVPAIECRVVAVLPRSATTGERLAHAVRAAATGGGVLPPSLLGELLKHVERLQREVLDPMGVNTAGLTTREIDVLRLMAEGKDTVEIAGELSYSERSVKHIIQGITGRLKLKNRPHAVAYAVRAGVI